MLSEQFLKVLDKLQETDIDTFIDSIVERYAKFAENPHDKSIHVDHLLQDVQLLQSLVKVSRLMNTIGTFDRVMHIPDFDTNAIYAEQHRRTENTV